jgi:hypothetical protein
LVWHSAGDLVTAAAFVREMGAGLHGVLGDFNTRLPG